MHGRRLRNSGMVGLRGLLLTFGFIFIYVLVVTLLEIEMGIMNHSMSISCTHTSRFVLTSTVRRFVIILIPLWDNTPLLWCHRCQHFHQRRHLLPIPPIISPIILWIVQLHHPFPILQKSLQKQRPPFPLHHTIRISRRSTLLCLQFDSFPHPTQCEQYHDGNDGKDEGDASE